MAYKQDAVTAKILKIFEEIDAIPRKSGNEEGVRRYLVKWATAHKLESEVDKVGNVIIRVPASKGMENRQSLALQGHMDMVCEKTTDSPHDFTKDPIKFVYDGEWLKADRTTLGADNGIAIAMALAAVEDSSVKHPQLELLFTVAEETGLTGAIGLEEGALKSKYLLNIDSEDDEVFTIGCAGGKDTDITLPLEYEEVPNDYIPVLISVTGGRGGHSGSDINMGRANAIKILARALECSMEICDTRCVSITGGTAHNAIPRDAEAVVWVPAAFKDEVKNSLIIFNKHISEEFKYTDKSLSVSAAEMAELPDRRAMLSYISLKAADLILALPHGAAAFSPVVPGMTETSSNLAIVKVEEGNLEIKTNVRSSVKSRIEALSSKIRATARLAGAHSVSANGYVPWTPDFESKMVKQCAEIYKKVFDKEVRIEAIHAGLECGLIGEKHPGMEMLSLGPTIQNCHSPQERLNLPSVSKMYKLIKNILQEFR